MFCSVGTNTGPTSRGGDTERGDGSVGSHFPVGSESKEGSGWVAHPIADQCVSPGVVPPGGAQLAPHKEQLWSPAGSSGTRGSASISQVFITAPRSVM